MKRTTWAGAWTVAVPLSAPRWWKSFVDYRETIPQRNAFEALKDVYQLFGLLPSAIPFADGREISEEAILSVPRD